MAHSSEVTPGLQFAWRTERPYVGQHRKSSVFTFLDAEWLLEMQIICTSYWVYLHKKTAWGNFQPFEVIAWIEDDRNKSNRILCQRTKVSCGYQSIWQMILYDLLKQMPDFKDGGDFTVVCMLHSVSSSGLKKESKHQSIQASLDLPLSASLDASCPPGRVNQSIQASLELSPDLEGLSLDLSNLLEKGTMPDVDLKCRDGIVPAHRLVLTARSEVFEAMFRNDMVESRSGVVDMPDMDSEVLGLLLKYAYTGKLSEASVELMCKVYAASNKYAIHGLKKACSEWMTGGLTEENCLDFLVLADAHCDAPFKDAVVSFIVDNQGVLFGSSVWFRFQEQQPKLSLEVFNRFYLKWQHGNASLSQK